MRLRDHLVLLSLLSVGLGAAACRSSDPEPGARSAKQEEPRPVAAPASAPSEVVEGARTTEVAAGSARAAHATTGHLVFSLSQPARLGGFELSLRFEDMGITLGEPELEALRGYICAANNRVPGQLRISCAGLPNADVAGRLARLPLTRTAGGLPAPDDFRVAHVALVDDLGQPLEGVSLELSVER